MLVVCLIEEIMVIVLFFPLTYRCKFYPVVFNFKILVLSNYNTA